MAASTPAKPLPILLGVFLLAVAVGRFVLVPAGSRDLLAPWLVLAIGTLAVFILVAFRLGKAAALVLAVLFAGAALAVRTVFAVGLGWPVLLLLPVMALTLLLVGKVVAAMGWMPRRAQRLERVEKGEEE